MESINIKLPDKSATIWISLSFSITHGYIMISGHEDQNILTSKDLKLSTKIFRPQPGVYINKEATAYTSQIFFPTSSAGGISYGLEIASGDDLTINPLVIVFQNDTLEKGNCSVSYVTTDPSIPVTPKNSAIEPRQSISYSVSIKQK
jgi:hypothetical protein